jgi:thiol-disulfide isomerase/thioredoxin
MKNFFFLLLFGVFILFGCKSEKKIDDTVEIKPEKQKEEPVDVSDITVKSYTYNELKPLLNKQNDSIYVINFWATWCKPCIEEMPYFEKLNQEYASKNVEVLLVSLDFPKQIESRLKPFIKNKNIKSKVVLLDDINEDIWIKAIDENWSGAIPATLIYNKDRRKFYMQTFTYKSLETALKSFLK